jgi:hypothetical protein
MSIDGETYIKFPSIGFFEGLKESKKEKTCVYCKKILKENHWWNFWSFRPFTEIGKDIKTGRWTYVCEGCTKKFVFSLSKQMRKWGKELSKKKAVKWVKTEKNISGARNAARLKQKQAC